MKKAILMVVLAAVGGGAWAQQWVPVSVGATHGFVHYVDPSTIRKTGHLRRYWTLIDLAQPDKAGNRSYRSFWEMDCNEARTRALQEDYFRGQMATGGRSDGVNSPTEWSYVAPGTVQDAQMKFVCSR
jgi:hypothetical protein